MLSRLSSMTSLKADEAADQKVQPDIWEGFSSRKMQDVIVELILPPISFVKKQSPDGRKKGFGVWPLPPTADDAASTGTTFREINERLREIGVSKVTQLRNAGAIVVTASRPQLESIAKLPMVRRIYANKAVRPG